MENRNEPGSTADKKPKNDEEILELAEEVLNSSDDEIIGMDDDAVVTVDGDDDVIDLTDVSDPPMTDEDEIIDLTEELQQSEEDNDITIAEDDEIMELEDITDVSADTEVAILELDEAIDALAEPKEEILAPEDAPIASDEDIIDLNEAVAEGATDNEASTEGPKFAIETETIELSDSDREALEQEFGFETAEEGLPEDDPVNKEPAGIDFVAGTADQGLDDTIELTETVDDAAQVPPEVQPMEEPLELTDEDRATLEEEIGTDTIEEIAAEGPESPEPLPMEEDASAALEEQLHDLSEEPPALDAAESMEAELHLDESAPPAERIDESRPELERVAESEIRFDAEELSKGDDAGDPFDEFGAPPDEETAESASDNSDALHQTMELADVNGESLQAEIDRESFEPASETHFADREVAEEVLDVGLDDQQPPAADEPEAAGTDASLAAEELGLSDEPSEDLSEPEIAGSEAFTLESPAETAEEETPLTAEALTDADTSADSQIRDTGQQPFSGTTFDSEEDVSAGVATAAAGTNGMSVDFDQAESFEQADMHKDADPISIRVKEPATEDHADEDALLDKVFDARADAASPQDLEQTVERIVGKMLSEKIEVILSDAIEKAVEKEIGRLKKLLLNDLNQLE